MYDYSQMSVDSLIELKNLVEDYPYSQSAQILYLLNLKRLGEDTFDTRLPHTAIHVNDRQKLKQSVEQVEGLLVKEFGTGVDVRASGDLARICNPCQRGTTVSVSSHVGARRGVASTPLSHRNARSLSEVEGSITRTPHPATPHQTTFRSKTISELLSLPKAATTPVTKIKLPQPTPQCKDDKLLEQLRLEALAKVNDRLNEIRKTTMVNTGFTETPKRMDVAKDIIDKVIATNPKISKVDDSVVKQNMLSHWKSKEEYSLREDFELVSETLAQLYITQGAPEKARQIYKTLSKTHPEKADYFTQLSRQTRINQKLKIKKS